MVRRTSIRLVPGMPITLLLSRRHMEIGFGYLVGYLLLDWISYVHPYAEFGITPWNPPTGLSFALILLLGTEFVPWLFIAPLVADWLVRGLPLPIAAHVVGALVIGLGYAAATWLLLRREMQFDATLTARRSLASLIAVAVTSTAVVGIAYTLSLTAFGILPATDFLAAFVRYWVGEMIGIVVVTPFLLIVATRWQFPHPSWEMAALLALTAAALWAVFVLPHALRFQLFYLLFLPVIWTAVRFGLEGVTSGLVITQIGLIAMIHLFQQTAADVTAYQALMVVLAVTGLAVGVLVSEQQRSQRQLTINREALNRAARLSTMGEFAAALAHEINQPLTAMTNYMRLAKRALECRPADAGAASEAAGRAIAEAERAAEVVRKLRDFIRLGANEMAAVPALDLIREVGVFCQSELDRQGVSLEVRASRELPPLRVDGLQIQHVLINLIRNAAEALADAGRIDGRIVVEAAAESDRGVRISVRDNGPGFQLDLLGRPPQPFVTTKQEGLGLGLSLARSVVEAHGGRLRIESSASGATVTFTLPTTAVNERVA